MSLTHDDVQRILQLLDASNFDSLHLEFDGLTLDLRRNGAPAPSAHAQPAGAAAAPAPTPAPTPAPAAGPAPLASTSTEVIATDAAAPLEIRAPMLGTFYRAPKPGAEPFIAAGSRVEPDTVIGIIEVMKLMNPVAAGVSGEVLEVVAADATLVEYDQLLARVRPA